MASTVLRSHRASVARTNGDDMPLSEEQIEKLKKVKRRLYMRSGLATFLHLSWLFMSNLLTVILNALYVHNDSFVFLATLGSAVVIMSGLRSLIEEFYLDALKENGKILGKDQNDSNTNT